MATIQQRGKGYRVRVSCGYSPTGKQIIKSFTWTPPYGTPAKQIQKELTRQVVLFEEKCKAEIVSNSMLFRDFVEIWKAEYCKAALKQSTLANYQVLERLTTAAVGHLPMKGITTRIIQEYINNSSDISPGTIRNRVHFISGVFEYAIRQQLVEINPCTNVTFPRQQKKKKDIYSVEEITEFLALLEKEPNDNISFKAFFSLVVYTGCRKGELLGLEWGDINFATGEISVERASYYSPEAGTYTDTPKNDTSVRKLLLPPHIIQTLTSLRAFQTEQENLLLSKWHKSNRLFTTWNGFPMNTTSPNRMLQKFCEKHNFKCLNVHSFRHLAASLLIRQGVDIKAVQAWLGHSKASTTLDIYAHSFSNANANTRDALQNALTANNDKDHTKVKPKQL